MAEHGKYVLASKLICSPFVRYTKRYLQHYLILFQYPSKLGPFEILAVRDLTGKGHDSSQPDNKPVSRSTFLKMQAFVIDVISKMFCL